MLHSRHKLAKPSFMVSAASVKEGSNLQIAATGPNFRSEPGAPPPRHGSSRALCVYGGAQLGSSLATGFFTGESTRKPVDGLGIKSGLDIKGLPPPSDDPVDSTEESRPASRAGSHPLGSHPATLPV